MKKDWLGYILLPAAIVGIFGGLSMVSDRKDIGWLGIVVGLFLAVVSYRLMTPAREPSSPPPEDAAPKSTHAQESAPPIKEGEG